MDKKLASGEVVTYVRNCWYKNPLGNKCQIRAIRSDIIIDEINHHIDREIDRLSDLIRSNTIDESKINKLNSELNFNKKLYQKWIQEKAKF